MKDPAPRQRPARPSVPRRLARSGTGGAGTGTIAFFGLFGVGNLGNEASLAAGLETARRCSPEVEAVVVAPRPEKVTQQHGVPAVPIDMGDPLRSLTPSFRPLLVLARALSTPFRWVAAYRFARSVDALVVPGTGILDDFAVRPHQMPYELLRWSIIARLAGRPWVMIGVGAGPIRHPLSRWLLRRAARNAQVVTYRDEISRRFMAELGVASPVDAVQPDVAFALPIPSDVDANGESATEIGVGVMTYIGWINDGRVGKPIFDTYIASMTELVGRLLSSGHVVRLLIGARADDVAVNRIFTSLRRSMGPLVDRAVIVEPINAFEDLLAQLRHCEVLIATRFHNVIAGLMTATPTISLGYAEKNRALMRQFGLDAYCQDVEDLDVRAVERDVATLIREHAELRPTLRKTADHLGEQAAERTAETLCAALDRRRPTSGTPASQVAGG